VIAFNLGAYRTENTPTVGRVVFYAVGVVSKESRRLVLLRTSCYVLSCFARSNNERSLFTPLRCHWNNIPCCNCGTNPRRCVELQKHYTSWSVVSNHSRSRFYFCMWVRNSLVSLAARLRAGRPRNRGSIPGSGERFSLLQHQTHPAPYILGTGGQECGADHPPPSSAEVKNGGAVPRLPHTPSLCGA
jgi:hypothetical protein